MKLFGSTGRIRQDRGSAILVLMALLAIAAIFTASNQLTLRRFYRELQLLEKQQRKKFIPPLTPLELPDGASPTNHPSLTNRLSQRAAI